MLANTAHRYGSVARSLHWIIALLVLADLGLGLVGKFTARSADTVDMLRLLYSTHKTIGVVVLALAVARVIWALTQTRPVPTHPERRLETLLAETVHWALYAAIFLLPVSGWVAHSAETGFAPIWWPFGQNLPFVPKSEAVAHLAGAIHWGAALVLIAAVGLHILGALKHAVIERDGTMSRMLTGAEAGNAQGIGGPHKAAAVLALGLWVLVVGGIVATGMSDEGEAEPARAEAPAADTNAAPETAATPGAGWAVQEGTLAFVVQQMGSDVTGHFEDWTAEIDYDPETGAGQVKAVIDTTSLDLGSVTDQAKGAEFFDVESYQNAVFEGQISRVEGQAHTAEGTLTLIGQTAPVTLTFDLEIADDIATMTGTTTLDRRDFGMGKAYEDEATVGFPVKVDIALTARNLH